VFLLWCTVLHVFSYTELHVIMSSQPTVVAQPLGTIVIMSIANPLWWHSGACVVWVVWGYVVGGTPVSGTTQQCTINIVLYTTQTL